MIGLIYLSGNIHKHKSLISIISYIAMIGIGILIYKVGGITAIVIFMIVNAAALCIINHAHHESSAKNRYLLDVLEDIEQDTHNMKR